MGIYRWSLFSESAQRYVPLTIKYDETGKVTTPFRQIAKHSAFGWGNWNHSHKLATATGRCWSVSTPGHGGLILVTQEKLPFIPDHLAQRFPRMHDLSLYSGQAYEWLDGDAILTFPAPERLRCPLYVYEFEEDCAWSVLLYHDRVALVDHVRQSNDWRCKRGDRTYTPDEYLREVVEPTVRSWHPEFLVNEQEVA